MSVREGMVSREIAPSIFMSSSVRLRASPQETRVQTQLKTRQTPEGLLHGAY